MYRIFPFSQVKPDSSIVIYGNGQICYDFLQQIHATDFCRVTHIADKDCIRKSIDKGITYIHPNEIASLNFDFIVIASLHYVREMYDYLVSAGVDQEKIIVISDCNILDRFNDNESKVLSELRYWKSVYKKNSGKFNNNFYERLMLAIAREDDDSFLYGKIVADFGCGPRGSLKWAASAKTRIGIDVLANRYFDSFSEELREHNMIYLTNTEDFIPLATGSVDVLFSVNSLDHVKDFQRMCRECLRIIKKGGEFIASFNLGENASICEPQCLNEDMIMHCISKYLTVTRCIKGEKSETGELYKKMYEGGSDLKSGGEGFLWLRGIVN